LRQIISFTSGILRDSVPDGDMTISNTGHDLNRICLVLDEIIPTWRAYSSILMTHPSASFGMWTCVQTNLDNIRVTLQRLRQELEPIVKGGQKKRSLFKVYAKAWILGLHSCAIITYRGRLEPHRKALKVGATMMNM
jgi:hypothetical protein